MKIIRITKKASIDDDIAGVKKQITDLQTQINVLMTNISTLAVQQSKAETILNKNPKNQRIQQTVGEQLRQINLMLAAPQQQLEKLKANKSTLELQLHKLEEEKNNMESGGVGEVSTKSTNVPAVAPAAAGQNATGGSVAPSPTLSPTTV